MAEAATKPKKVKVLSEETRKRKRESDKVKARTRINIGQAFPRWRELKDEEGCPTDADLAVILLDNFLNEAQNEAGFAKDVAVPTVGDPATHLEDSTSEQSSRTRDVACQTDTIPLTESVGTPFSMKTEEQDYTFDPAETDTTSTETADNARASWPVHKTRKYIIYEKCIMELFEVCPVCKRSCSVRSQRIGTFIRVEQQCKHCKYSRKWNSQPVLGGSTPAGNLHISAAVYLCGASFCKFEKICSTMNLQLFKYDTFRRHSRLYIEPAIVHKWTHWRNETLERLSERERVIVGGDMRADSPGHSAKFGSYTMMDLQTNTVVDVQLVQSNEVGGSYHMEKEGLQRSLALLEARGVTPECIVTDRHPQIQKFLRERNINQFYDVWRIEKEITRKLENISKMKDCGELRKWQRSIKNHIHWTASSSTTGPERVAKWKSILNHVRNVHTHEDPNFPACLHPLKRSRDRKKWLVAGTRAFYKLQKVMTNKRILKDVTKLSPHHQTASLESFHSAIQRFAPKNVAFPYLGMLCRLFLAAFHYNENSGGAQATSSAGHPLSKGNFPKARKGQCTIKQVKTPPTFKYLDDLLDLIFDHVFVDPAPSMDEVLKIPIPPDFCAEYERPDKEEVVSTMVSGFNHQLVGNQHICPDHLETHGEPSSSHRLESLDVPHVQGNPSTSSQRSHMPETCKD
ncbi:hypothetical protein F2P79_025081 [Pimephales promelas]|nr:hypothetical protein F2P79_025081 [Pimephales promelas]